MSITSYSAHPHPITASVGTSLFNLSFLDRNNTFPDRMGLSLPASSEPTGLANMVYESRVGSDTVAIDEFQVQYGGGSNQIIPATSKPRTARIQQLLETGPFPTSTIFHFTSNDHLSSLQKSMSRIA